MDLCVQMLLNGCSEHENMKHSYNVFSHVIVCSIYAYMAYSEDIFKIKCDLNLFVCNSQCKNYEKSPDFFGNE